MKFEKLQLFRIGEEGKRVVPNITYLVDHTKLS